MYNQVSSFKPQISYTAPSITEVGVEKSDNKVSPITLGLDSKSSSTQKGNKLLFQKVKGQVQNTEPTQSTNKPSLNGSRKRTIEFGPVLNKEAYVVTRAQINSPEPEHGYFEKNNIINFKMKDVGCKSKLDTFS